MGSLVEFNDTLKIARTDLPSPLTVGTRHTFRRPGIRLFHPAPVRVFLVEEIDGQWNFLGKVHIIEQTIDTVKRETRGIFSLHTVYADDVRKTMNRCEAPEGKGYEE